MMVAEKDLTKRIDDLTERIDTLEDTTKEVARTVKNMESLTHEEVRALNSAIIDLGTQIARVRGSIAAGERWSTKEPARASALVPQETYDTLKSAGMSDKEILAYYNASQTLEKLKGVQSVPAGES